MNKILLVEDDLAILGILKNVLADAGFNVITAVDGQLGLDSALKQKPDLILLDILMPVMDGMTMLEKLRKDEWGSTVKVMILTNLTDVQKMSDSLKLNVSGYLVKSNSDLNEIVTSVKKVLNIEKK